MLHLYLWLLITRIILPMDVEMRLIAEYESGRHKALLGDQDKAITELTHYLSIRKKFAEPYYYRGVAFSDKGDYPSAVDDFTDAIFRKQSYYDAYVARADARFCLKDFTGSERDLTRALALQSGNADLYYRRARVRARVDVPGALEDYTLALAFKPKMAKAAFWRGLYKLDHFDSTGAVEDFTRTLELHPGHYESLVRRGRIRLAQRDTCGALMDFGRAIDAEPLFEHAYLGRMPILKRRGEIEKYRADSLEVVSILETRHVMANLFDDSVSLAK